MILNVTNVTYLGEYTLLCKFNNGETRKIDLSPLLEYPAFVELKDKNKFEPEYLFNNGTKVNQA